MIYFRKEKSILFYGFIRYGGVGDFIDYEVGFFIQNIGFIRFRYYCIVVKWLVGFNLNIFNDKDFIIFYG